MPHVPKPSKSTPPPDGDQSVAGVNDSVENPSAEVSGAKPIPSAGADSRSAGADSRSAGADSKSAASPDEPSSASVDQVTHGSSSSDVLFDSVTGFENESGDQIQIEAQEHQLSLQELSDLNLLSAIRAVPEAEEGEDMGRIEIVGAEGQHAALMRIDHAVKLRVQGSLGDYAFAFNSRTVVKVFGSVGHGVAEGMVSGSVRVRGNAGHGAGVAMSGGTLGIYGAAGDRVGGAMRGGGLFVRGDVGDDAGLGALGGTIVIGGDAGENLGDPLSDIAVFIRGRAASLAEGVTEAPLRKKQEVQLGLLLISAGIRGDAKDFRRIVPTAKLDAENASRGEVVPNWR